MLWKNRCQQRLIEESAVQCHASERPRGAPRVRQVHLENGVGTRRVARIGILPMHGHPFGFSRIRASGMGDGGQTAAAGEAEKQEKEKKRTLNA